MRSKLASYIGALALAGFGAATVLSSMPDAQKVAIVGLITTAAGWLNPALKAQLDEAGGQLVSVLATLVAVGVNTLVLSLGLSEGLQVTVIAALNLLIGVFVPGIHLQQAELHSESARSKS